MEYNKYHKTIIEYEQMVIKLDRQNKKFTEIPTEIKDHYRFVMNKSGGTLDAIHSEIIKLNISDDDVEYKCSALASNYERCKQKVKFLHKNINKDGENFKYKKNIPFCARHSKTIIQSSDGRSLKNGFYYESDLYKDEIDE